MPFSCCSLFTVVSLWVSVPFLVAAANVTTTVYVCRHFEVRDYDQPVKYVFSRDVRVARVTGSLNSTTRVQRLRLFPGWNLRSLAVTAQNFAAQISNLHSNVVDAAFLWDEEMLTWQPVMTGQTVQAASILWLHAITEANLPVIGQYNDPTNQVVSPVGQFLPAAGLEAVDLRTALLNFPLESAFTYDSTALRWFSNLPSFIQRLPDLPLFLAPGEALFIKAQTATELQMTKPVLRVQYYHQDHLGSSSVVTDSEARIAEETAFYPFGAARNKFELQPVFQPYTFTQKESDRESRLHYFEARYLSAPLGRFLGQDLQYAHPDALSSRDLASFLSNPQQLNGYSYVRNNPLRLVDPDGRDPKPAPKQRQKALVVYTPDMFADAKARLGYETEASYRAALAKTYREEAGPNASIIVRSIGSKKDLKTLMKSSSYETVVFDSHAYLNKPKLIIGNDELSPEDLKSIVSSAKSAPKKFFFYGCKSAKTGFAGQVSGLLPNAEVTGSINEIRQSTDEVTKDGKVIEKTLFEDRSSNRTFKGGVDKTEDKTIDNKSGAPLFTR
jgi:RHS repeat-associated protein